MTPEEHFTGHGALCECGASEERIFSTPEARTAFLMSLPVPVAADLELCRIAGEIAGAVNSPGEYDLIHTALTQAYGMGRSAR